MAISREQIAELRKQYQAPRDAGEWAVLTELLIESLSDQQRSFYNAVEEMKVAWAEDIADWSGSDLKTVNTVLKTLVDLGLLTRERKGRKYLYKSPNWQPRFKMRVK
jgi:predicted transcriptional regulator